MQINSKILRYKNKSLCLCSFFCFTFHLFSSYSPFHLIRSLHFFSLFHFFWAWILIAFHFISFSATTAKYLILLSLLLFVKYKIYAHFDLLINHNNSFRSFVCLFVYLLVCLMCCFVIVNFMHLRPIKIDT